MEEMNFNTKWNLLLIAVSYIIQSRYNKYTIVVVIVIECTHSTFIPANKSHIFLIFIV